MPANQNTQRLEYTVLDMIESAVRAAKATPLNLGGVGGFGGGLGGPPGGFIGRLPQYQVAYDMTEAATLDTLPSGFAGSSGWSLVDNLNHIRYRLNVLESGSVPTTITVIDDDTSTTFSDVDTIHFSGAGVSVVGLGGGDVRVIITASGGGGLTETEADSIYLRLDASNDPVTNELNIVPPTDTTALDAMANGEGYAIEAGVFAENTDNSFGEVLYLWRETYDDANYQSPMIEAYQDDSGSTADLDGDFLLYKYNGVEKFRIDRDGFAFSDGLPLGPLTVMEVDGTPTINGVDKIIFSGATVLNLGNGDVLVAIASGGGGGGIEEAPIDGQIYGRQDGDWTLISGVVGDVLHKYNDDLTSQIPSRLFTTSLVYASGTLRVYFNGIRQRKGIHYLDDVNFITFSTYFPTASGDIMVVDYDYLLEDQTGDNWLTDVNDITLLDSDNIQLTE